jgi:hypothetical protein
MTSKILTTLSAGCTAILMCAACGTSCQDLVAQYASEKASAQECDPTVANSCTVQLPIPYGLQEPDGSMSWEGLASNCNSAFNPARSAQLQAIYEQFQAQGCKAEPIPICGATSVSQCTQGPAGYPTSTGYICEDGG